MGGYEFFDLNESFFGKSRARPGATSGVAMRGFGVEVWVMRDGKIAIWEAAFNVSRADQSSTVAELIR